MHELIPYNKPIWVLLVLFLWRTHTNTVHLSWELRKDSTNGMAGQLLSELYAPTSTALGTEFTEQSEE